MPRQQVVEGLSPITLLSQSPPPTPRAHVFVFPPQPPYIRQLSSMGHAAEVQSLRYSQLPGGCSRRRAGEGRGGAGGHTMLT